MPFLQSGGKISAGQESCAGLRLEPDTDPVRLPIFLAERPPQLKIDRLPGNDAAQRTADGGTGTCQDRDSAGWPAAGDGKRQQATDQTPQRPERLKHRKDSRGIHS